MAVSDRITDSELARIQRLCEATTGGPWNAHIDGPDHESGSSFIQTAGDNIELTGVTEEDYNFIASARQDVPLLLDEVRALREQVARLNALLGRD